MEEERNTTTCEGCENEIDLNNDDYYTTADGDIICVDCYNDNYFTCEDCGEIFYTDYENYVDDRGIYVCDNCRERYYYCDDCNHLVSEDSINSSGDRYYCDNCYCDEGIIHDYHSRDIGINYKYTDKDLEDKTIYATKDTEKNAENMLKMGMEIEVENSSYRIDNNEMAKMIRNKYPHLELVFEEDGSLNNGFEIITQPMTMSYIREHKEDFKGICEMLSENGFISHNAGSCGQHIHFSRCYFSDDDDKYVGKLLLFFERYKNEIYKFSRRNNKSWCSWVSDIANYDDKYYKSSKIICDYAKDNTGHGVAINLEHSNTIEIRVFRGTLKYETMMSNFEFVNSLVHIIKEKPIRQINFDKVINYEGNEYLTQYCLDKEIYNSEFMSDETTNIFNTLKTKKESFENVKVEVKNNIKDVIKDMIDLTKNIMSNITEYDNENQENIKKLLTTSTTLQQLITNNIDFINSPALKEDNRNVEENYKEFIRHSNGYDYSTILRSYENIRNYLPKNEYTNDLITKMEKVIDTLREKYASNGMGGEI